MRCRAVGAARPRSTASRTRGESDDDAGRIHGASAAALHASRAVIRNASPTPRNMGVANTPIAGVTSANALRQPLQRAAWRATPTTAPSFQRAPTSRSVLVRTSCTSRTFGPLNISRGGRLEWASAKSLLWVQATKSSKLRHQVFTS